MKNYILFILILFFLSCKNTAKRDSQPLIRNVSKNIQITNGLYNKHIAIWGGHGMYFDLAQDEWTWQRPCLFQTVEDLLAENYVQQYIVPMLENAGANVLMPRERDIQTNEIIIDNDFNTGGSLFRIMNDTGIWSKNYEGFAHLKNYYKNEENPFTSGTFLQTKTVNEDNENICEWIPSIPQKGKYAVYVSYKQKSNSTEDAHYSVYHTGGRTDFLVNQTMGGGTWIFLGYFFFREGFNEECKITLTNKSNSVGQIITADAVKIGGGMGNIIRNGKLSNHSRYAEGARYWLHWAGTPSNIYNTNNGQDDYKDDYLCRGLWVNYLLNESSQEKGLNIPIDASIAIHTDAGVKELDTIVGTLGIYSSPQSRDLTKQIVDEIVCDIRLKHESNWTNRHLKKRTYSEVKLPKVPAALIELFSHQNMADVRLGVNPHFQFTVGRAIYKGILKYIANKFNYDYVVQPLPIENFGINNSDNNKIRLSWRPALDTLEPTAVPDKYLLFTRVNEGGFNNGTLVSGQSFEMKIENDKIYGFKITAVNKGGESFPSEILTVCKKENRNNALIVNCFNSTSAPSSIHSNDSIGFVDFGIPYMESSYFVGPQYDFNPKSMWIDTSHPGFGSSNRDFKDTIIVGNIFDYTHIIGRSIVNSGFSYTSCSLNAFLEGTIKMKRLKRIYLILGRNLKIQKLDSNRLRALPVAIKTVLEEYNKLGCEIYIGMDEI